MRNRPLSKQMQRILRIIPDAGDDSISTREIAERLEMNNDACAQLVSRAVKRGLIRRLRIGAYQLPGGKQHGY